MEENELTETKFNVASSWLQKLPDDQRSMVEDLPLCRDMVTRLTYLRDNKVTGTPSTGNLPLKAVHEICAWFINPLNWKHQLGNKFFACIVKLKSGYCTFCKFWRRLVVWLREA